jgi:hypothetical protein
VTVALESKHLPLNRVKHKISWSVFICVLLETVSTMIVGELTDNPSEIVYFIALFSVTSSVVCPPSCFLNAHVIEFYRVSRWDT